jgi:uncharacterized protein (UPF0332 family)
VRPQTARFLEKGRQLLEQAETMLGVALNEAAGRTAYLAGYLAAQAVIFERVGRAFKTHAGVHTEFLMLTRDDPRIDHELRGFLSRTYNLKAIADFELGQDAAVSAERATAAVETAKRFLACCTALVT